MRLHETFDLAQELLVSRTRLGEKGSSRLARLGNDLMEQIVDELPAIGAHCVECGPAIAS